MVKRVSPHKLRHTFASHLIKNGEQINTVRVLLGHASITSTQIYLHVAGEDMRRVAKEHPIGRVIDSIEQKMGGEVLPFRKMRLKTG